MIKFLHIIVLGLILFAYPNANAQNRNSSQPQLFDISRPTLFNLPIDCTIGEDCWVMNYVDMGINDDKRTDPACYNRTYNNHKGTDFAILDGKVMEKGVQVIAPMDGTVTKIRDGEEDLWATKEQLDEIRANRKECGNVVLIDHGDGLETIYCHMKKDSITVKPNQKVKIGDKIGEVGLSGLTEFPHLHFGILKDKKIIDPFTGQNNHKKCGKRIKSLWHRDTNLQYQPMIIQSIGFANDIPDLHKLERDNDQKDTLPLDINAFTFWTILLGVRDGDKITLEITDPNGKMFAENEIIQEKNRARQFYFIGKNLKNKKLIEGAYTGFIKIERQLNNGKTVTKDKIKSILITR